MHYENDTKAHYKDDSVARGYHDAYSTNLRLNNIRFRLVARNERNAILRFLTQVKHKKVLDIPAGTGKLAPIFKHLDVDVTACDISENMLQIAQEIYAELGYSKVVFQTCDAANVCETLDNKFDVVVCLRLLHRVPKDLRRRILNELSRIADHAIVSFGAESLFHRSRRKVRNMFLGGGEDSLCYETLKVVEEEVAENFDIVTQSWVIPILSQEMIFLLKPRSRV